MNQRNEDHRAMTREKGKWVQAYTRRGALRRGIHRHEWRSASEQREETLLVIFALLLATIGFGALLWRVFA